MSVYKPTFSEAVKGNWAENTHFVALNVGTDAYVTERDMNELQWLQIENTASLIREMTYSGVLSDDNTIKSKKCYGIINNDKYHLNGFELSPFKTIMNGFLTEHRFYNKIDSNEGRITVTLPNPPVKDIRHDFVFIEFWFKELKENDLVSKYGGFDNGFVKYNIIDERINEETSRKIQLIWKISQYQDWDNECTNGFLNQNNEIVPKIHPWNDLTVMAKKYSFEKTSDPYLFRAGEGLVENRSISSIDGYVYAIPLFLIERINNSGYDATNNPFGGINYVNNTSVSDRPDNKFANIIYEDQITDLRHLATLNAIQYKKIFTSLEEYYTDTAVLRNKVNQLTTLIKQIYYCSDITLPSIYDKQLYGCEMYKQEIKTGGAMIDETDEDASVVYRKQKIKLPPQLQYKDYAIVPTFVDFDFWNKGAVGDFYIDKHEKYCYLYNTGAKDVKASISSLLIDNNMVYSDYATFSGMEGTVIELPFVINTYKHFVYICPLDNNNGYTGYTFIRVVDNQIIVYNSGQNINKKGELEYTKNNRFQWVVIDMENEAWKNINFQNITLNSTEGHKIVSNEFGEDYTIMLGTPICTDIKYTDSGDIYADISNENEVIVYNTGTNNMDLQVIIFNEVDYQPYYDSLTEVSSVNVKELEVNNSTI